MLGLRHRLLTFLFLAVTSALLATGIPQLRIDTSFDSLISASDPTKAAYEAIKEEFGSDNTTIVYIRDPALWTEEKLLALEKLSFALEDLPFVEKVESLFNVRSIRDRNGDIESSVVLDGVPVDSAGVEQARANALYSPLVTRNFISTDGTVTALSVNVRKDATSPDFDRQAFEAINAAIDPVRGVFTEIYQVGPPRVNEDLKTSLYDDMKVLGPLSLGVLMATIVIFLRSGMAAAVPLCTAMLSLIWTFGLMGFAGVPVNVLSAMLPSLVIVIGSTEDTHMLATYLTGLSEGVRGRDRAETRRLAVVFMAKHMGLPVLLTTTTTVLGFASNGVSEIALIRDFAFASTAGIAFNGLITALAVPLILSLAGPLPKKLLGTGTKGSPAVASAVSQTGEHPEGTHQPSGMVRRVIALCEWACGHPNSVIAGTVAMVALFGYFSMQITVSNDPISYFRQDHALVQDVEKLHRDLSGMELFYINLQSSQPMAFKNPENLRKLSEIKAFIMAEGKFDNAISLADHLSLVNREFHGGEPAQMKVPATADLVEQYLLFFQRSDLESYVSHDFQRVNMVVRHNIHNSHELTLALADLERKVAEISGGTVQYYLVGQNLMINRAAEALMVAQLQSIGLLLVVIFVMMSLVYTSLIGGVLSLIPNIVPIVMTFGLMGLLNIPINPGTATVAVIAIGIAIDDTIHLLSFYAGESRRTPDRQQAVRITIRHEAIPVVSTTVALIAGFLVLVASNFSIVAQFGMLSALAMAFALIADLIITPVLMAKVRLVSVYEILLLKVGRDVLAKSPLFEGMTSYQARKAILLSQMTEFQAGTRLIRQGSVGREMFLILSGDVAVTLERDGEETRLATLSAGAVFGEAGFVRDQKRSANVDALSDGIMLTFEFERVRRNMWLYPHIASRLNLNIARILGERLAETSTHLAGSRQGEAA